MIRLIWVLLFLSAVPALAGEQSFLISGKQTAFFRIPSRHLTLSKDCRKGGAIRCDAYAAISKATLQGVIVRGGANPGARICSSKLGGEVVIGTDKEQNENSFCRFADGSLISCGSLAYYGRKNDLKRIE